ncbi:MAG: COG4315 family predicted lipoprotein [Acidimicrobiales bacterium]
MLFGASWWIRAIIVAVKARLPGAPTVLALCTLAALGCGACGSSGPTSRAVGPSYEVTTGQVGGLGTILVNGKGYTLYVYAPDAHSSRSTCTGVCAVAWPPVLVPKGVARAIAGRGVDSTLLGVTRRANGTNQVTYAGWPLYRWVNDTSPGDATGQNLFNLGGKWYVVSPDGTPVH